MGHDGTLLLRISGPEKTTEQTHWEELVDSRTYDTENCILSIINGTEPIASGYDGMMAVKMIEEFYSMAKIIKGY